jgi:hypothetical protein
MATSGTYSWTSNRDFIVTEAFRKIGRLGDFETISGTSDPRLTAGINALNPLVKALHADGMPLWKLVYETIPMSKWFGLPTNQAVSIGPGQSINQLDKPLKIIQALRRDNSTNPIVDVPMNIYTFEDYERLSYKASLGAPIHIFYRPLRVTGDILLWPQPDTYWNTNGLLFIRYHQPFQDFNNSTDEPDFPVEWHEALIYLLAVRIAPEYGLPIQEREMLMKEAMSAKELALSFGTEEGSLYLHPQHRWM